MIWNEFPIIAFERKTPQQKANIPQIRKLIKTIAMPEKVWYDI